MKKSKKRKYRIALFTDILKENFDGVTYTLYNLIERIPKDKFEFIFITPYPPSPEVKFPYPVIVCRYIPMPLYKEYLLAFPYFDKNLKKTLGEFKPDLIHFTTPSFLGRYALRYGQKHNIPVVSTYHTHFPMYIDYYFKNLPFLWWFSWVAKKFLVPMILRFSYNNCARVYVPTKPVLDDLAEVGIEPQRLTIWARGIDMSKYNARKRDKNFIDTMCGKNTVRILFVSRLFWIKEIRTIVRIFRQLTKSYPNTRMIITGDGPQRKWMEKRMPGAVFTGKLLHEQLERIYASSDIFLFPSITETFGNVVLEALASGLPVVAAARGGPVGILREGETGFLVEPKNVDEFCDKLGYLIDNPDVMEKMSRSATEYARTQKWEILCREMFDSYENIITEHSEKSEEFNEIAV